MTTAHDIATIAARLAIDPSDTEARALMFRALHRAGTLPPGFDLSNTKATKATAAVWEIANSDEDTHHRVISAAAAAAVAAQTDAQNAGLIADLAERCNRNQTNSLERRLQQSAELQAANEYQGSGALSMFRDAIENSAQLLNDPLDAREVKEAVRDIRNSRTEDARTCFDIDSAEEAGVEIELPAALRDQLATVSYYLDYEAIGRAFPAPSKDEIRQALFEALDQAFRDSAANEACQDWTERARRQWLEDARSVWKTDEQRAALGLISLEVWREAQAEDERRQEAHAESAE